MPIPVTCQATLGRKPRHRAIAALAVVACLALPACVASSSGSVSSEQPAKVEDVAGSPLKRVTLTERAAERIDVKTTQLSDARVAGQPRKVIPYAAVIYEVDGSTWVYTMPQPLTYIRERVTVEDITGDRAVLTAGPAAGTAVVTQGAALLYGTELGVGK